MKKIILIIFLAISVYPQSSTLLLLMGDDAGYAYQNFEVEIYTDTLTTVISDSQIINIDSFVTMLKDSLSIDSLSEKFDVIYLLANETSEIALRNLVKTTHSATAVNSPIFTAFEGFTGNGVNQYINTNYNTATQRVNYLRNDNSWGGYFRTNIVSSYTWGNRNITLNMFIPRLAANFIRVYSNSSGVFDSDSSMIDIKGLLLLSRVTSSSIIFYHNGIEHDSGVLNTSGDVNANVYLLGYNNNGSYAAGTTNQLSFWYASSSLSATEALKLANVVEWYMDAIGKGVIP